MVNAIEELKVRAQFLQRKVASGDEQALARLHALASLRAVT